ncbi:kinase-like protein [Lasiosphaeria hispida]|uniref:non-specific serine/threonine protein kinase n=1 Tax=Lasiosphaeria hispida TaxID=260671 RepID=A0AAJ0M7X1_9PEZI|nr:kinase-like protein [Lasiosphaeria hispida]
MSGALFRAPADPTVIHRAVPKGRPSLQHTFQHVDALQFSNGAPRSFNMRDANTESSKNSNGNSHSGKSPDDSTAQTSLDSKFHAYSSGNLNIPKDISAEPCDRGHHHMNNMADSFANRRSPNTRSSPDSNLTTIQETVLDQVSPSVITVERAAAAKIFLETYFNERLASGPSPRSIRLRLLESHIFSQGGIGKISADELEEVRAQFCKRETNHLRETRVMKARSIRALAAPRGTPEACLVNDYEVIKILGKGSFGVVRLVREKHRRVEEGKPGDGWSEGERRQVYAMKVIRKSDMLRTSQEGHLRAERDFLVASEGSMWIVPLIASFQDATSLYLVMEYMPGGDFLGLLIRENTLHETVARFYVAEMVLCVEAAHALRCIHRDIKPDNFLISASGHLKISDFGLAFDGHWSHDTAYYNSHRYSLLGKLGINVEGDDQDKNDGRSLQATMKWASNIMSGIEKHDKKNPDDGEPLLNWRNRCGNRTSAMSVVGTSQYMAPEVGRQVTKHNILKHKETFGFPHRPVVSHRCQHLIASLIQDKENRLCSKRYRFKDLVSASSGTPGDGLSPGSHGNARPTPQKQPPKGHRDFAGRYVFPYDAEDIKAHKWFRGVPWERLHEVEPPHVPQLRAVDDTHYFKEEDEISDWSESDTSDSEQGVELEAEPGPTPFGNMRVGFPPGPPSPTTEAVVVADSRPRAKAEEARLALRGFRRSVQKWALTAIATPFDTTRLRNIDAQIDGMPGLLPAERTKLRHFVRAFGRKDRKRPRDRLLRDREVRGVVMDVRKKTAFLGYTWRRMRPLTPVEDWDNDEMENDENMEEEASGGVLAGYEDGVRVSEHEGWQGVGLDGGAGPAAGAYGAFGGWGDDVVAVRALHRGRMSMH